MPRTKKELIADSAKKSKSTSFDISIEERLAACGRGETDAKVYVGQLVERIMKGEFGAILKALTAGRASREIYENRDGKLSSDRVLGRIEMAELIWDDLEQFVLDKDSLMRPSLNREESVAAYNYSPD